MILSESGIRARLPAVAGLFYPDDPYELRAVVRGYLDAAAEPKDGRPKVLIVPHAGFVYSGPVAASAYRCLAAPGPRVERVVLAGPSHRVPVPGIAVPQVSSFQTPLGPVALDRDTIDRLLALPHVYASNLPHRMEHSLEVQLPFLQMTLEDFKLVPLAVGDATPGAVANVLEACWGGPETLIVISTDLSHYLGYDQARRVDAETARQILTFSDQLQDQQACGCRVLNGLMRIAPGHDLQVEALDLRNSGDTSGEKSRVVGYGSFALREN
jgi:AmmeMemoRadiSam system protein B